jgi:hypothetical protein
MAGGGNFWPGMTRLGLLFWGGLHWLQVGGILLYVISHVLMSTVWDSIPYQHLSHDSWSLDFLTPHLVSINIYLCSLIKVQYIHGWNTIVKPLWTLERYIWKIKDWNRIKNRSCWVVDTDGRRESKWRGWRKGNKLNVLYIPVWIEQWNLLRLS